MLIYFKIELFCNAYHVLDTGRLLIAFAALWWETDAWTCVSKTKNKNIVELTQQF